MGHRHEWRIKDTRKYMIDYADIKAVCDCGKTMNKEKIERRLNAVEALSAEDARTLCLWLEGPTKEFISKGGMKLQDYARILGGEDETE